MFSDIYFAMSNNYFNKSGKTIKKKSMHILKEGILFFYHHLIHSYVSPGWKVNFSFSNPIFSITPLKHNINQLYNEGDLSYQFQ